MRKLLGTLVLICLIVAGVGLFRGWFDVSKVDEPGQTNVQITIDKEKIREDAEKAKQKAKELAADGEDAAADAEVSGEIVQPDDR